MDKEKRIIELQDKIDQLSKNIELFQQDIALLQQQLDILKKDKTSRENTPPIPQPPFIHNAHSGIENYIGLKFMHLAGIIVLVTGLSIGVKYAIDKQMISALMRIVLAYAAGLVLFFIALRLKQKYLLFSAILFSGSMASVYFTTYAASVYYHFFSLAIAFVLMTGLTIYTVIAAINYNREEIAILGMIGAYAIPFLVSTNSERIDLFFSYILLINMGVAFISFRRSWKIMQYFALFITWILFAGWALLRYDIAWKKTAILFMIVYYILFLLSAMAGKIRLSRRITAADIQQVVINNIALYIAALLTFGNGDFSLYVSSTTGFVALVIIFLALAFTFFFRSEVIFQRIIAWQAIVLTALFIAFQWEGVTVTLLWIGLALLLFAWGIVGRKSWPRLASILLIAVTLGKLIIFDSANFSTVQKIISYLVIGVLLLLFSFYYQRFNLVNSKNTRN